MTGQREKAIRLHQLHGEGNFLILPNVWDVLGAKLLEDLGYPAIATASASIAYVNGYPDGEKIPFRELLSVLKRIAKNVNTPVTADIESGFTDDDDRLRDNIRLLIKTGIAGINLEDTSHQANNIFSVDKQCKRIRLIRAIASEMDLPLFINARTDVLLHDKEFPTDDLKYEELLKRGYAYKEAGADCFYPIALRQKDVIERLVTSLQMPINILTLPGIPELKTLKEIGVRRVSLGPSFFKTAIRAMRTLAVELRSLEGLSSITENEITSEYLKSLIKT